MLPYYELLIVREDHGSVREETHFYYSIDDAMYTMELGALFILHDADILVIDLKREGCVLMSLRRLERCGSSNPGRPPGP